MSESSTSAVVDKYARCKQGLELIWNNEFDKAEKLFDEDKAVNPRSALHYAEAVFLKSFITADSNDTQAALKRLESARDLASSHIAAYEKGAVPAGVKVDKDELRHYLLDARVILGDALYMTAILQMTRDSKIKGAFNLRKSWKLFEGTEKMLASGKGDDDAELARCVEFGAGIFYWAISIIPKKFLKFVELAGFKSDRDLGLSYLRKTHEAAGVRGSHATILLLANNLVLPRGVADISQYLEEADALIAGATKRYPHGSLFQVMGSHCRRKQCDVDGGIEFMLAALDSCKSLKQEPLIYRYELACCYCMKLEFDKAADIFEELIKASNFQVRAICAMQLAGCRAMLNDQKACAEVLKKVPAIAKKGSSLDKQMARQAERFGKNGGHFCMFELLYMRRDLVKMTQYMEPALAALEKAAERTRAKTPVDVAAVAATQSKGLAKLTGLLGKKKPVSEADHHADDRAAYLLVKGSMLKALDKHADAVVCFTEVVAMKSILREKFYLPYCLYELGESQFQANELDKAHATMKACQAISGYDWEDPLKVRMRIVNDQITAARKKAGTAGADDDDDDDDADGLTDEEKKELEAAQ